jgi:molybdopterin synthase catalytic subunit
VRESGVDAGAAAPVQGAVYGAMTMDGQARVTVLLTEEPLSLDAAFRAVLLPACGGTALFVGTTRSPNRGRVVEELEYEAYQELAGPALDAVGRQAAARHRLGAVYLAHRVGVVPQGEPSVIVAASAPHRAEAFDGCRELIDELKRTAPIWKKERWVGGGRWVGVPEPDVVREVSGGS